MDDCRKDMKQCMRNRMRKTEMDEGMNSENA